MAKFGISPRALFIFGACLSVLCTGLNVTYISELITGTTRHGISSQLGLITFLFGLLFGGVKMMQVELREMDAVKQLQQEQSLLNRAKQVDGLLTVSDAALNCRLSISETRKAFDRLGQTGVCQVDVNDKGELFYRFPTFERDRSIGDSKSQML